MCAGAALVQAVRAALAGRSARHAALNARSTKCVCGPREKLCARRPTPPPTKPAAHVGRRCEAAGITLLLLPPHARVGMCSAAAHTLCRPPSWYNSLKLCMYVGRAAPTSGVAPERPAQQRRPHQLRCSSSAAPPQLPPPPPPVHLRRRRQHSRMLDRERA